MALRDFTSGVIEAEKALLDSLSGLADNSYTFDEEELIATLSEKVTEFLTEASNTFFQYNIENGQEPVPIEDIANQMTVDLVEGLYRSIEITGLSRPSYYLSEGSKSILNRASFLDRLTVVINRVVNGFFAGADR